MTVSKLHSSWILSIIFLFALAPLTSGEEGEEEDRVQYFWTQMPGQFRRSDTYLNFANFSQVFHVCGQWNLFLPVVSSPIEVEQIIKQHLGDVSSNIVEGKQQILLGHQYINSTWYDYSPNSPLTPNNYLNSLQAKGQVSGAECDECLLAMDFNQADSSSNSKRNIFEFTFINPLSSIEMYPVTKNIYCANRTLIQSGVHNETPSTVEEIIHLRNQVYELRSLIEARNTEMSHAQLILINFVISVIATVILIAVAFLICRSKLTRVDEG